jgi:hypothetical protein
MVVLDPASRPGIYTITQTKFEVRNQTNKVITLLQHEPTKLKKASQPIIHNHRQTISKFHTTQLLGIHSPNCCCFLKLFLKFTISQ